MVCILRKHQSGTLPSSAHSSEKEGKGKRQLREGDKAGWARGTVSDVETYPEQEEITDVNWMQMVEGLGPGYSWLPIKPCFGRKTTHALKSNQ